MQLFTFTTLAAIALSCGAAAAQSKPRVLVLDEGSGPGQAVLSLRPAEAQPGDPGIRARVLPGLAPNSGLAGAQEQGFLGVQLTNEGEDGARVSGLVDGAPAAEAGLKPGDRITAVDGSPIQTAGELTAAVRGKQPGAKVKLTLVRGEETLEQEVTLGTRAGLERVAPEVAEPRVPELAELLRLEDLGQVLETVEVFEHPADAPEGQTRRIEVRKTDDGGARTRVWVNGQEVHEGQMELHELDGDALGLAEQVFEFRALPNGEQHVLRPGQGGAWLQRGDLRLQSGPGALPRFNELAERVDALEERLGRIEQSLAELRALLGHGHDAHGHDAHGHDAQGQPHATPEVRVETRVERRTDVEPRMRVERRSGRRAEAPAAPAVPPAAEAPPVDELRREIRDLMRAIERLERGGGR